jgi:hypothetical protein
MRAYRQRRRLDVGRTYWGRSASTEGLPGRFGREGPPSVRSTVGTHPQVEGRAGQSSSRSLATKCPSIEVSALVASAIITLVVGEWWHWVPVIAAIVVIHVLRK